MRLVFILLSIFTFNACISSCTSGCKKKYLKDEHLRLFQGMSKGDLWIYRSNLGNYDTLVVQDVDKGSFTNCNRFELGEYQYQSSGVLMILKGTKKHKDQDTELYVDYSYNMVTRDKIEEHLRVMGVGYNSAMSLKKGPLDTVISIKKREYEVRGFTLYKNAMGTSSHDSDVVSFYWNKEKGLLRYVHKDGEVFDLIKN